MKYQNLPKNISDIENFYRKSNASNIQKSNFQTSRLIVFIFFNISKCILLEFSFKEPVYVTKSIRVSPQLLDQKLLKQLVSWVTLH